MRQTFRGEAFCDGLSSSQHFGAVEESGQVEIAFLQQAEARTSGSRAISAALLRKPNAWLSRSRFKPPDFGTSELVNEMDVDNLVFLRGLF